ncbi:MAG TPA: cob(I)yrinic acid a,c-diamide adenosyltransferase [Polyangiaceae bacterium]|nr:cob(I)yrinic acid a,c-diamide adenosyltransferase [Polyangiaceae bacterium]
MKIYTKTGDSGQTRLFGGTVVNKDDLRVDCYGSVDELNAALGVARASGLSVESDALCVNIQSTLFVIGAELATLPENRGKLKLATVGESDVHSLENAIDRLSEELPPLTQFILPGGVLGAAELHRARTICRRAERLIVALHAKSEVSSSILIYLNRLGDLLFVLARHENARAGCPDIPWAAR